MSSAELFALLWSAFKCRILCRVTFGKTRLRYRQKADRLRESIHRLGSSVSIENPPMPVDEEKAQLAKLTEMEKEVYLLMTVFSKIKGL